MSEVKSPISIFWLRRDLRLEDNVGLYNAIKSGHPVLLLFIFDTEITDELAVDDHRISYIYRKLEEIHATLNNAGSGLLCLKGRVEDVWGQLLETYSVKEVYANEDYEPYAVSRDAKVNELLEAKGIPFFLSKDQVIFAKGDVLKNDGAPYTVFTPYKNRWLSQFSQTELRDYTIKEMTFFAKAKFDFPSLEAFGFCKSHLEPRPYSFRVLTDYAEKRDFPAEDGTSHLGLYLRFGTISVRRAMKEALGSPVFMSELIWREFFMQILYHYPDAVVHNFKRKYDRVPWRNNLEDFEKWQQGNTGYPLVDAGMRELNETGYMHNRVRMVVASFLCKHLLIDWRWGEAYFAQKLFDYELSSNNGNWQWAAGTGCDAAPYFRVFNPITQADKFDKTRAYIRSWVPELETTGYCSPIVDHKFARERAIATYKKALE